MIELNNTLESFIHNTSILEIYIYAARIQRGLGVSIHCTCNA